MDHVLEAGDRKGLPVAFICYLHLPPAAVAGSGGPDRVPLHFLFQMKGYLSTDLVAATTGKRQQQPREERRDQFE